MLRYVHERERERWGGELTVASNSQVGKPKVGENRPSRVRADVTVHLAVKDPVRVEWESQLLTVVMAFLWLFM